MSGGSTNFSVLIRPVLVLGRLFVNLIFNINTQPAAQIQKPDEAVRDLFLEVRVILDAVRFHGLGEFGDNEHQRFPDIAFFLPETFFDGDTVTQLR